MSRTTTHIDIEGEFTIFTAAAVRQRLIDAIAAGREVEVNLSQVSEFDSAGLQLMIAAKRQAATHAQSLRFSGHSEAVFDILELCDLVAHLGDPVLIHSRT